MWDEIWADASLRRSIQPASRPEQWRRNDPPNLYDFVGRGLAPKISGDSGPICSITAAGRAALMEPTQQCHRRKLYIW